jgi:hypothetical protein
MVGKVYNIPPQPPVAEHTTWFEAGALSFGVEYRELDPGNLLETYKDTAHLADYLDVEPEGGFTDEGVSLHVKSLDDDFEYVRFDVFEGEPHYHYVHRPDAEHEIANNVIDFDVVAHGDMLAWAIGCLRHRLPDMLTEAGGAHLVPNIDLGLTAEAIDQVEALAIKAQANQQAVTSARS